MYARKQNYAFDLFTGTKQSNVVFYVAICKWAYFLPLYDKFYPTCLVIINQNAGIQISSKQKQLRF